MSSLAQLHNDHQLVDFWDLRAKICFNSRSYRFNIESVEEVFLGENISFDKAVNHKKRLHCFIEIGREAKKKFLLKGDISLTWKPKENLLYIGTIWIEPKFRNQGLASFLLQEIGYYADLLAIHLCLHVVPFSSSLKKPTSNDIIKLKSYYKRFRFQERKPYNRNNIYCLMERVPIAQTSLE